MQRTLFSQFFTAILGVTLIFLTSATYSPTLAADPIQHPQPASVETPAASLPAFRPTEASFRSFHYLAGTLLQGSTADIFYLTEAGTRRPIYNQATLRAFGLADMSVVQVDDALLNLFPLDEALTPLVRGGDSNLYWVANGQRWLVNGWKPLVGRADYRGIPVTPLDSHLEQTLPVRIGLERGLPAGHDSLKSPLPIAQPVSFKAER